VFADPNDRAGIAPVLTGTKVVHAPPTGVEQQNGRGENAYRERIGQP
jgi:hypothetical protein